jgi:hypothetical protein
MSKNKTEIKLTDTEKKVAVALSDFLNINAPYVKQYFLDRLLVGFGYKVEVNYAYYLEGEKNAIRQILALADIGTRIKNGEYVQKEGSDE